MRGPQSCKVVGFLILGKGITFNIASLIIRSIVIPRFERVFERYKRNREGLWKIEDCPLR